jgi:hypothetical protein
MLKIFNSSKTIQGTNLNNHMGHNFFLSSNEQACDAMTTFKCQFTEIIFSKEFKALHPTPIITIS